MHVTTVSNLKKLQEVINDSIKSSNEYSQSSQDESPDSSLYEVKIDLEWLEEIARKFIEGSDNILEKEMPIHKKYTIVLPMNEQLVENLQKLEKGMSDFIRYVDKYNQLERANQYPALFQFPGEDSFIALGKMVQILESTGCSLSSCQEETGNALPQGNTKVSGGETPMVGQDLVSALYNICKYNPDLLKKFQNNYSQFLHENQYNFSSQDTLNSSALSGSLLSSPCFEGRGSDSWFTSWSLGSTNPSLSSYWEDSHCNQNQSEEFDQHFGESQGVHSILSMQKHLLLDANSLPSTCKQESLQTSPASSIIPTHYFQQRRLPSYDVNKKFFDSIDYQEDATWVSKCERPGRQSLTFDENLSSDSTTQKKSDLEEELCSVQQKLDEKVNEVDQLKRELDSVRQDLAAKTMELGKIRTQLEESKRELDGTKKGVLRLKNDLRQERSSQQITVNDLNSKITQLTNENSQLVEELSSMQQNLKGSNLGNENKKLLKASTQGKKRSNYAREC